ncbi:hypothetical protein CLAIMM_15077 [Cladophialophora immunda]|nr:hypothetical protein CLAIMM_15077 [Cladophialophora immunda]
MIELTVGEVSGVIAAIITALQILLPTMVALVLVGLLNADMTATTWSSVSATLHGSYWATLFRADTVSSTNVQSTTKWLLWLGGTAALIISLASIVTPIGLYDEVGAESGTQDVSFPYVADSGPFGYGTPGRSTLGFNRQCGVPSWRPCPGSDTIEIESADSIASEFPFGYDSRVPSDKITLFQSGLKEQEQTVSSIFDIQFRSHTKRQDPDVNNGSFYETGSYRQLGTLILDDTVEAVEGLVVDMVNGAVAFRNHTLPATLTLGGIWREELLVMQPETQCVNTNLTIDFTLSGLNGSVGGSVRDIVLTDRGGFANIVQKLPEYDRSAPQVNADLQGRAYQSAWFFNVLLAVYYNVTRPSPDVFGYLESEVGKTLQLPETTLLNIDELAISSYSEVFSTFLANDNSSFTSDDSFPYWPNPFGISRSNFSDILDECNGVNSFSKSNMSNVGVACGLIYGVPRLANGNTELVYEPGARLSMPLISCASAVKVSVQTFNFRFNGTSGLRSLHVDSIDPQSPSSRPLYWGIENNSDLDLTITDAIPLWGLVSSDTRESSALSVVKSPHLYLTAYMNAFTTGLGSTGTDNMPGLNFPTNALASVYNGDVFDSSTGYGDYSGKNSFAMYAQWQKLSATTNGTARIVNLIYTDVLANGLVGTKSWLPASDAIPGTTDGSTSTQKRKRAASSTATAESSSPTTAQVPVQVFTRKIRYHWVYGIPAYMGVFLTGIVGFMTLVLLCLGRASPSKMRTYLNATSPGISEALGTRCWRKEGPHRKATWVPHASQPLLYPEKLFAYGSSPGATNNHGFEPETDVAPLIDQKTGVGIQMTPMGSPMPGLGAGNNGFPGAQYQPHHGYVNQFGGGQHQGVGGTPHFPPPPTRLADGGYPAGGFAR